jgi:hypothetical protein
LRSWISLLWVSDPVKVAALNGRILFNNDSFIALTVGAGEETRRE